jgi:protease IV
MGQFFKFLFASCLGVLLAIGVLIGIGGLIFASFANQASKPKDISANSVLRLTFEDPIPELTNNIEPDPFTTNFQDSDVLGLHDITATIRQAAEDDNIKGILLEPGLTYNSGFSTTRALRDALEDFADSGKFVISHSKFYLLKTYYLASAGTEVHVNPAGIMEVRGFSAEVPFYKDMLDRLEVDPQVFYSGKFKSATEPFRRNDMSPENREQVREYLTDYYDIFLDDVSRTRTIDRAELKRTIDEYLAGNPEEALRYKLVDGVSYRTEVEDRMRELIGLDEDESVKTFSLKDYYRNNPPDRNYRARDKVAVIYAEGTIVDGEGANGSVGDERYIKTIQKVAKDDRVQAIVLRVNSPGGSALASENIWHALTEARESGKPLVVSMGDYAASGGYYISAPADSIFAQPNTLTGSIGVFRIMPNLSQTFGEELGIDWDSVKVSDRAIGYSLFFDLTQAEQEYVQRETDAAYELFLSRVAEGRGMSRDDVHEVAQGRVWTGQRALDKGLVDKPGDLQRAIASAVKMAELEDYRVVDYPQVKDPFTQLLEEFLGADANVKAKWLMKSQFPKLYPHYKTATELRDMHGVQARMPFEPVWN